MHSPGLLASLSSDWLSSLSSEGKDESEAADPSALLKSEVEATGTESAEHIKGQTSETDAVAWLLDLGFDAEAVRCSLEQSGGDADEALMMLSSSLSKRKITSSSGDLHSAKRHCSNEKDTFEVEGFSCRRHGSTLRLCPPFAADVTGPAVGKFLRDGGISFDGLDEWALELYHARIPSAGPDKSFNVGGALGALRAGQPWLCPSFASAEQVRAAHAELEAMGEQGLLESKDADTTAAVKARSDRVVFLDLRDGTATGLATTHLQCPPECLALFRQAESAAAALCGWPEGDQLLVPGIGMASVYDGKGAHYAAHRDNELQNGRWLNYRALTIVLYVNPSGFESPEDGGTLRCHVGADASDCTGKSATHVKDVLPRGGTAVFFPSKVLLHEVLPSHRRRYALTLWLLSAPLAAGLHKAAESTTLSASRA